MAKTFRAVIRTTTMQQAMTYAMAQYCKTNPTEEAIRGVNKFVDTLVNLAEPVAPDSHFPNKQLDSSVMNPPIIKPQTQTQTQKPRK